MSTMVARSETDAPEEEIPIRLIITTRTTHLPRGAALPECSVIPKCPGLRIFQRFRLVKFIKKFKTRVKNLKIEKIIAFNKYLHELFFAFYFHPSKNLFCYVKK